MPTHRRKTSRIATLTLSLALACGLAGCHFYNIKRNFCTHDPKDTSVPRCEKKAAQASLPT